jgi:hypothetical protein
MGGRKFLAGGDAPFPCSTGKVIIHESEVRRVSPLDSCFTPRWSTHPYHNSWSVPEVSCNGCICNHQQRAGRELVFKMIFLNWKHGLGNAICVNKIPFNSLHMPNWLLCSRFRISFLDLPLAVVVYPKSLLLSVQNKFDRVNLLRSYTREEELF